MKNQNWKKLDIDALLNTSNQVVIGFKSSPILKLRLVKEASANGMNLGSYVRMLIEKRSEIQLVPALKNQIENLKQKISNYETPEAKALLVNYVGKPATYYDNGEKKQIIIKNLEDVFFVVHKSFKIN